ncbi:MAG: immune inhibitor A [Candidatus Methanoperedens sp.]|nr:immune inhibitor A [Candidatus Methanoperedens sp.]
MDRKTSFFILLLFSFFIATVVTVSGSNPEGNLGNKSHDDVKNETIAQESCQQCHNSTNNGLSPKIEKVKKVQQLYGEIQSTLSSGNYTAIMEVGQTEHQLGFAFRQDTARQYNGWQWWDTDGFGQDKQKNMIVISVLDNSTGTAKPVTGLTSLPSWPRATVRKYSGTYSYKADNDPSPITTQNNYPDKSKFLLVRNVNLTKTNEHNLTNATLNFHTWYSMEADWDYCYISVSTDGINWINLPGTITTNTNPNNNNQGNGITGSSGGLWVEETMDLTPYIGKNILLAFRFISDDATNAEGMYVDDIYVNGKLYCPPGKVCGQILYTPLYDDAEAAPEEKTLSVNVSYPKMTIINYSNPLTTLSGFHYDQYVQQVNLQEYPDHPGTYYGYFLYYGFAQQYQGNYIVNLNTNINGNSVTGSTQFNTTMYGCQNCHNSYNSQETSFIHPNHAMGECAIVCHSGSRGFFGEQYMGPPTEANPMHLHEMIYGHAGGWSDGGTGSYNVSAHLNVSCSLCHTGFIHDNTGPDTETVASYTLHGTNTAYSSGVHGNLTCEYCHGNLTYPNIPPNQYSLTGILQNYTPSFTSSLSFTDTYVTDVNGSENLALSITGDNKNVWLYVVGPIDNMTTGVQKACGWGYPCRIRQNLPIDLTVPNTYKGRWLISVIMMQTDGTANYTITSNYPLERKPIIKIPECNECHKNNGIGKTNSQYNIPDWNPGFAHADTNEDGILDVQCRMCHDSMHDIKVKACQSCHISAPVSHPISDPAFSSYTATDCLKCHGDPHNVTGGSCIGCHSTNDVNVSKFGRHTDIDISDGAGIVTDKDCGTCHYNKDMNKSHIYLCDACHSNSTGIVSVNDPMLIKGNLSHDAQSCKSCHAPVKYHMNGTAGPKGFIDTLLSKIT